MLAFLEIVFRTPIHFFGTAFLLCILLVFICEIVNTICKTICNVKRIERQDCEDIDDDIIDSL